LGHRCHRDGSEQEHRRHGEGDSLHDNSSHVYAKERHEPDDDITTICLCTGPDFFTAPSDLAERLVIVVAPVLATGNTATAAIDRVKERGAKDIRFVCLIAVQQGVERVRGVHPDVRLWTAALDDRLDERGGFIVPALGDAGDRAYGTK
jgi:uracil phosphoribosyltransferase